MRPPRSYPFFGSCVLALLPLLAVAQPTEISDRLQRIREGTAGLSDLTFLRQQPAKNYGPDQVALLGDVLADYLPNRLGGAAGASLTTYEAAILLVGFVGQERQLDRIPPALAEYNGVRRAINLARVRLGNAERRANLLKNLADIPVDDDFNYVVLPLLTYTRQREIFDYLWEQVLTAGARCHPADAETPGRIDCAYRIIEALALTVADFPIAADPEGNLLTDDYAAALAEVRRWYAANHTSYRIRTDTY